ncbi:type I secretion system permease/ATPase [Thermohalobaculum xanthum]|uniref:type I secretion system permease/ATPase n=1 Tax=Thermohalobaculum xanthum TaxID=2753746 RepID=UPI002D7E4EF4|nr:type I secretion system permease/ATPase [Thermohalobaculum xanthum]
MTENSGRDELRAALARFRGHFAAVGVFSAFVNLLMLTGPLFMLQVYDRVLSSRSEATLVALIVLITILFGFMGVLDYLRGRVLSRVGAAFQSTFDSRVFTAALRRAVAPQERARPNTAARDLDALRQILSGPAPFALFDVPWVPIYLGAIFLFHTYLGWTAVAGGLILVALTALNQMRSRAATEQSQMSASIADALGEQLRQNAEAVQGLGMTRAGLARWKGMREEALEAQIVASDCTATYSTAAKTLRFYLQSLMLGMGAYLVLQQEISPGMMIAASILMGRALAPIDQAIGQWPLAQRALLGWRQLSKLLEKSPPEAVKTRLPAPKGHVEVNGVAVVAPGESVPVLRGITFRLEPGQALGVIGPSGAGKTTLAKVLAGVWPAAAGKVRIDGAALDQWNTDELGQHIGYLPQEVGLLPGTVAQNIARLSLQPNDEAVIEAAQRAGAHDLLLALVQGYDTEIGAGGQRLSGGQRQRVALARAFYGDPAVLILDEPNANLDAQGEQALVTSIREAKARGRSVIVMAHRPSAIAACDLLLVIDKGQQVDLGPRDEVLRRRTKNHEQIVAGAKELSPPGATIKAQQKGGADGLAASGAARPGGANGPDAGNGAGAVAGGNGAGAPGVTRPAARPAGHVSASMGRPAMMTPVLRVGAGPAGTAAAQPKPEPKPEPKVESKPEPKVEPKAEPKVEPKAEPEVEPRVEAKAEPKVAPKAELKLGSKDDGASAAPETEAVAKPEVITKPAKPNAVLSLPVREEKP